MPDPFFGAGDPFFGANNPFFAANNRRNDAFQAAAASRAAAMANAAARGREDAASITVLRSDEPVSVNTATLSASDGTQRTSMQTTTSGGFVSQTTTSSSSSSSSSSFNNKKNPNQQQQQQQQPNDRVALGVATPTADVVFNVGPTLGEVGIRATGASTAASQGMSMNAYTVVDAGALAVSDGAVVEASANANASSPPTPRPVNVTVMSPAVDFTFAFAEGTTNASEGEGGATFVACIRLPASRNLSEVAIVAPAATVAMSFGPNQQQPTSTSVSRTGPSAPTGPGEGAFITHTADVSVQLGGTVVEARRLFGLRYPAAWAADLTDEALQTAAPRCVRRTCNGNGADASSGGVACPADFVVPT